MSAGSGEDSRRPPLHKRRYVVEPAFQYRLVGTFFALGLANSVFFSGLLYFFYKGHLLRFYDLAPRQGTHPLVSVSTLFSLSIAFVFGFGLLVLFFVAWYMSHQIAGPLYRTKEGLYRVGRGDFGFSLQFRQRDFVRDIPPLVNGILEALRREAEADLRELRAIEASADDAAECGPLVRRQRERKEAQLGMAPGSDPESVSPLVH